MRPWVVIFAGLLLGSCQETLSAPAVPAAAETTPVGLVGEDAADDPAIWLAADPAATLIIGTQKKGGLYVYDLTGKEVQSVPFGRPNNIDLRPAFPWADGSGGMLVASDRADNTVTLWKLDETARRLEPAPRARIPTNWAEVYGVCMGRAGDDFIVVATSKIGEGAVWRVGPDASDSPRAERIASFTLQSIAEGCVVDDANGVFYVAEELVGIWRAEIARPAETIELIDKVRAGGPLVEDVEGLAIYDAGGVKGHLIASVQGRSEYAVYDRGPGNAYIASFRIARSKDGKVDAVSGTDGIEVTSAPLPGYPKGLFIAQDDENRPPVEAQNFKLVSWADIEAAISKSK